MSRELIADYPQATDRYDELFAEPLAPRAHWKPVIEQLAAAPVERMRERLHSVQSQVRENGVTYNVYADPQGADRPWELDLLPMIIPPQEWSAIEAAIVQRATLLNRILVDVYGEQKLLKEGLLPPALVYSHAGFLRACRGAKPPGNTMLHFYAADIARSPDGRWWVIDDRTQAPSGAGYALENRIVLSRTLSEAFGECNVERLAPFFRAMRDTLRELAPYNRDNPRIALLTIVLGGTIAAHAEDVPKLKFEVFQDKASEYRWRLKSANGAVLATAGQAFAYAKGMRPGMDYAVSRKPRLTRRQIWGVVLRTIGYTATALICSAAERHLDHAWLLALRLGLVTGLARQLGGHLAVERTPGARCTLHFPVR
jgi:hypothetical protein